MTARLRQLTSNLALALVSFSVALGIAELSLRAFFPRATSWYVVPPGTDWTVPEAPGFVRGIGGVAHYRVNEHGIRGRAFGDERSEYRVLVVGGSTTQCANLDDSETWSHLLEVRLGDSGERSAVWVGDVGRSGLTTRHNVLHLKYLLRQYPGIDAVVALVGVNDVQQALAQGWHYRAPPAITEPAVERDALGRAFSQVPGSLVSTPALQGSPLPWYKATALWQLGRRGRQAWNARRSFEGMATAGLERARRRRADTREQVDSLPPLAEPLREYRRNLESMADFSAAAGARLVLVTHPALWKAELPREDESLLWFGWIGDNSTTARGYYTTGALARAMAAFNRELLEVCRARTLDCVDAAAALNGDPAVFYDDVHFTEEGARRLAEVLAVHFAALPPFRK